MQSRSRPAPTRAGRGPVAGRQAGWPAAADAIRRTLAPPRLPARRRPRHQRQPGAKARSQLCAREAVAALARHARPRQRRHGIDEHRPPTRTRSVMKNRALAAAYAGAHRFGVEVFEPATSRVLMAALLVHDLHAGGGPAHAHPWQDEAHAAAHGGLWRTAYTPAARSGSRQRSATAQPENDAPLAAPAFQRSSHHAARPSGLRPQPIPNPAHTFATSASRRSALASAAWGWHTAGCRGSIGPVAGLLPLRWQPKIAMPTG